MDYYHEHITHLCSVYALIHCHNMKKFKNNICSLIVSLLHCLYNTDNRTVSKHNQYKSLITVSQTVQYYNYLPIVGVKQSQKTSINYCLSRHWEHYYTEKY